VDPLEGPCKRRGIGKADPQADIEDGHFAMVGRTKKTRRFLQTNIPDVGRRGSSGLRKNLGEQARRDPQMLSDERGRQRRIPESRPHKILPGLQQRRVPQQFTVA
jgi:hypothetical protein